MATSLRLRPTSAQLAPQQLRAGCDLVLDLPLSHGIALPPGVLADDHLTAQRREDLDRLAQDALDAWCRYVEDKLRMERVSLAEVWGPELYAEVFLPTVAQVCAARDSVRSVAAERVELEGFDRELAAVLVGALGADGVAAVVEGETPEPPSYPTLDAAPTATSAPLLRRFARGIVSALGLPGGPRPGVLVIPYHSTAPVLERLLTEDLRPVMFSSVPPPLPWALRCARRGGWTPLPGWRRNRDSRRRTLAALDSVVEHPPSMHVEGVELGPLLTSRATRMLRQPEALTTAALEACLKRSMDAGRIQACVLPYDRPVRGRLVALLANDLGVPTMMVQHGFTPMPETPEGELCDYIAAWSARQAALAFSKFPADRVRVTGNPALPRRDGGGVRSGDACPGRAVSHVVVLAQNAYRRSSIRLTRRISAEHVAAALDGLAASGIELRVTIRPHPADDLEEYRTIVARLGAAAEIDQTTPLSELFGGADLCVGSASTATLETALHGIPVVVLNVSGASWRPPLDGAGAVPVATSAAQLADVTPRLLGGPPVGPDELLDSLGVSDKEPARDVVDWLETIVRA